MGVHLFKCDLLISPRPRMVDNVIVVDMVFLFGSGFKRRIPSYDTCKEATGYRVHFGAEKSRQSQAF